MAAPARLALLLLLLLVEAGHPLVVDVERYGAVGDNATLNTASIRAAIAATAAAGGGVVRFARGSYLTGRVELASHVQLWIGPLATLQGSADASAWTPYRYRGCIDTTKRDFVLALRVSILSILPSIIIIP